MTRNILHDTPSQREINTFREKVYAAGKKYARSMPWRDNIQPYSILLSEIMLQQTQVERVKDRYLIFTLRFKTISDLAKASLKEVLAVWSGLGYNRRALWLHSTAKIINEKYAGNIPSTIDELILLPGIGRNTAGAIVAYACNKPSVFIETNIRSVFIHEFFQEGSYVDDKQLLPYVDATLDKKQPRKWYWALMDYGAELKRLYNNPAKKSKHYSRQSQFEGSNRQMRGKIIRYFLKHEKGSADEIARFCDAQRGIIEKNLIVFMKEGFLRQDKDSFTLR